MGEHDNKLILWFEDIGIEDVPLVGGKNASLGEMYQKLTSKGVAVPHGFAITAYAYQYLLKEAGIEDLPDPSFNEGQKGGVGDVAGGENLRSALSIFQMGDSRGL